MALILDIYVNYLIFSNRYVYFYNYDNNINKKTIKLFSSYNINIVLWLAMFMDGNINMLYEIIRYQLYFWYY